MEVAPVFDRAGMLLRVMGDEELMRHVLAGFLAGIPDQLTELRRYIAGADMQAVARLAHTIKGSAANIGAKDLRSGALRLEKAAQAGEVESVEILETQLESRFERLRFVLEREVKDMP